ncbi:phosphocarrier protein kinase/phosphorylase [Klebsiella pneumoniae]|uniref:Phosphocarrier protein kinase/phosphorylase n=1 Tax=Klebsiella pneumoniae TaxID=573 RepID=A0A2X3KI76_KLEPN|nr:phosphocarrier protein kinase/phosphorylase [Klebsiella pneumoniae]
MGRQKIIEKFAEQFAALSDGYLKERAGDLRTLGQRLLFHLDDSIQGPNTWPARIILVADELSATTLAECRRIAWPAWWCAMAPPTPMPLLWCGPSASQR